MSLILRPPWTRQPQFAAKPAPRFAAGLGTLLLPGVGDVASNRRISQFNDVSVTGSGDGRGYTSTQSGIGATLGSAPPSWTMTSSGDGLGDFALLIRANPQSGTSINYAYATLVGGSANAITFNAGNGQVPSSGSFAFFASRGAFSNVYAASQIDGQWHTWVIARSGGATTLYRDGVPVTLSGTLSGQSILTATETETVGGYSGANYGLNGRHVGLVAAWRRALSAGEMAALSVNPWQLFEPRHIWVPVSAAGGGDVAVNLTGASSTLSAGSLSSAVAQSVSGAVVTLSTGTLVSAVEQALSGAVSTFSAGTITAAAAYTLAGQAATAAAGTIIPAVEQPLTGAAITSAQGSISTSAGGDVSVNLSGQAMTASHGTLAGTVAYNLSGVAITAAAGTLDVSVAQVLSGLSIASAAGTITHTGGDSATYSILPPYIAVYFWKRTA